MGAYFGLASRKYEHFIEIGYSFLRYNELSIEQEFQLT